MEEDTVDGDVTDRGQDGISRSESENREEESQGRIVELLQEEREDASASQSVGNGTNRYKAAREMESDSQDGSEDTLPRRPESPIESVMSIPDDSPSVQVRYTHLFYV